eukprot:g5449.t1
MAEDKLHKLIDLALKNNSYDVLIHTCENEELDRLAKTPQHKLSDENLFVTLLLSYLLKNDPTNAFYLWKRMSNKIKKASSSLRKTWEIARGMYQRNLNYTFKSIQSAEGSYKNDTKRLFEALKNAVTRRTVDLIASSYSKVSLETVANLMHVTKADAKKLCITDLGWTGDSSSGMIIPPARSGNKSEAATKGLKHLTQLTECISFLESKSSCEFSVREAIVNDVIKKGDGDDGTSAS